VIAPWDKCKVVFVSVHRSTGHTHTTIVRREKDLSHSHFSALTVKNAISDYFRDRYNRRPDVSLEDPDLPLLLYLHRGSAMLYRVWSGDQSMHKRGYRQTVHRAALRETTAAVLLYLAGWGDRDKALLQGTSQPQTICDPMCGSGTLPIEAALMHADCAPGVVRYGDAELRPVVLSWADMEDTPGLWSDVVGEAKARDRRGLGSKAQQAPLPVIFANDIHPGAVALAKQSARLARVSSFIAFSNVNAADYSPGVGVQMAVTNPPWDLRLDGAEDSWTALGVFARREMQGSTVWALSGNPEITRHIRLKSSLKIPLSAASTQLRFLKYDVSKDD
jgi:putative N6-adenine-specific DNA methylase